MELDVIAQKIATKKIEIGEAEIDQQKNLETSSKKFTEGYVSDVKSNMAAQTAMGISTEQLKDDLEELTEQQKELQDEQAKAPDKIAALKKAYENLGGVLGGTGGDAPKIECPENFEWDSTLKRCVPVDSSVRDFGLELAQYELDLRTEGHELFIENELDREIKVAEKKAQLAEDEYKLFEEGDARRQKGHLKFLKLREAAERKALQKTIMEIDDAHNEEMRGLKQQARDKENHTFEQKRKELELEKETLKKKLEANKKYFKEWKKIHN